MLANLFQSLCLLKQPHGVTLDFLIVENNAIPTLSGKIESFRDMAMPNQVYYLLETEPGISSARNRAIEHAIQFNYTFLAFVDDDEFVHPDWVVNLLAERDRLDLDIIGSPVRPIPFDTKLTFGQRLVWSGIERSSYRSEKKCQRKCQTGRAGSIKIATGSWLGKLDFFKRTGLRFDVAFNLTGGEDWHLWSKAKSLGAKTGWCGNAIVYETVPSSRLTLGYHYRRNRDHNVTEFRARYHANPNKTLISLPMKCVGRAVKFLGAAISIPFCGGYGLVSAAAAFGGLAGIVQGLIGRTFSHYLNTTGY